MARYHIVQISPHHFAVHAYRNRHDWYAETTVLWRPTTAAPLRCARCHATECLHIEVFRLHQSLRSTPARGNGVGARLSGRTA